VQKLRCLGCGRVLLHYDMGALAPGKRVEVMCKDCKTLNRLEGYRHGIIGADAPNELTHTS
jgi:phage FluMu protein Com